MYNARPGFDFQTRRFQQSARRSVGSGRLKKAYTYAVLIVFHALLLCLLINGAAALIWHWLPNRWDAEIARFLDQYESHLRRAYPDFERPQLELLLQESWKRSFEFEPYNAFREGTFAGRYVNVSKEGIRESVEQGPWPPREDRFNVFVFGGSTTFGYGLPDQQTFPSFLQKELVRRGYTRLGVYNLGQGYYYSTQERILFERMLQNGHLPDLALFVDGLNEFLHYTDRHQFADRIAQIFKPPRRVFLHEELALSRLISRLRNGDSLERAFEEPAHLGDPGVRLEAIEAAQHNYLSNKQLIEAAAAPFEIALAFVWQPVPTYGNRGKSYPFEDRLGIHRLSGDGYRRFEQLNREGELGANLCWAAQVSAPPDTTFYVDSVHYTAALNRHLATHIVDCLMALDALPERHQ